MPEQSLPSPARKRELTSENFQQLLLTLDPDQALAAEKYEHIRRALVTFFACRGVTTPDELADETITRVALRLQSGAEIFAHNPNSYFYGVARNVWREVLARPATFEPLDDAVLPHHQLTPDPHALLLQAEEQQAFEQRLQCLAKCLQKLSPADRELIVAYYEGTGGTKIENRQNIAERFGIAPKTLRNKTTKLRAELADCVRNCLTAMKK